MIRIAAACIALVALSQACERPADEEPSVQAKFGVFFGGQIEERREVPFELDPAKQTQGFRVDLSAPPAKDVDVTWSIDMPASNAAKKTGRTKTQQTESHRKSIVGKATIHAGLSRFDQVTAFEPGDPLGLWNARIVVRGKVVVDRPFEVYDRAERARASVTDGGSR